MRSADNAGLRLIWRPVPEYCNFALNFTLANLEFFNFFEEAKMTDQAEEKTELEKLKDIISQLKEMRHHSETNITKLSEFWLLFDGKKGKKEIAKKFEVLLSQQNASHDSLASMVTDFEEECDRIEGKTP
jgi:hypothetical protein